MRRIYNAMTRPLTRALTAFAFTLALLVSAPLSAQTILALGDSLTAGYGLGPGESFPDQLQAALQSAGRDIRVINAGVSGDTSAGGKGRLGWLISGNDRPDVVIIELGANDGLRAIDPMTTRANLADTIEQAQAAGAVVLLAGMYAPPNLGTEYAAAFNSVFPDLALAYDVVFYPFFLEGVAGDLSLNLPDGIHPTGEGIGIIVENIMPSVLEALAKADSGA